MMPKGQKGPHDEFSFTFLIPVMPLTFGKVVAYRGSSQEGKGSVFGQVPNVAEQKPEDRKGVTTSSVTPSGMLQPFRPPLREEEIFKLYEESTDVLKLCLELLEQGKATLVGKQPERLKEFLTLLSSNLLLAKEKFGSYCNTPKAYLKEIENLDWQNAADQFFTNLNRTIDYLYTLKPVAQLIKELLTRCRSCLRRHYKIKLFKDKSEGKNIKNSDNPNYCKVFKAYETPLRTEFNKQLKEIYRMQKEEGAFPTVFLSYCWGDEGNEDWVQNTLAKDLYQVLEKDNVLLDVKNNTGGKPVPAFTNRVFDPATSLILIVSTIDIVRKYEGKEASYVKDELRLANLKMHNSPDSVKIVFLLRDRMIDAVPDFGMAEVPYDFVDETEYFAVFLKMVAATVLKKTVINPSTQLIEEISNDKFEEKYQEFLKFQETFLQEKVRSTTALTEEIFALLPSPATALETAFGIVRNSYKGNWTPENFAPLEEWMTIYAGSVPLSTVRTPEPGGETILHIAAMLGNQAFFLKVCAALGDSIGDIINAQDKEGRTPLYGAMYWNTDPDQDYDKIIAFLRGRGATLHVKIKGWYPLFWTGQENLKGTKDLMKDHPLADYNCQGPDDDTPLYWAALYGQWELVSLLMDEKEGWRALAMADQYGWTPLHACVCHDGERNTMACDLLLQGITTYYPEQMEKHLNRKETMYGRTAVFLAAEKGSDKCLNRLLMAGADPHLACEERFWFGVCSPLEIAAINGHEAVFKRLFKTYAVADMAYLRRLATQGAGAEPNGPFTPVHPLIKDWIMRYLKEAHYCFDLLWSNQPLSYPLLYNLMQPNLRDENGVMLLHRMIEACDRNKERKEFETAVLNCLLLGADPNHPSPREKGEYPLAFSRKKHLYRLTSYMVLFGAAMNPSDLENFDALENLSFKDRKACELHVILWKAPAEALRQLDSYLPWINWKTPQGFTPLMLAIIQAGAGKADTVLVEEMLKKGADAAAVNSYGATALHWACYCNHEGSVRLLLTHLGSKPAEPHPVRMKNAMGFTPLHWAAFNGNTVIATLLMDHGANIQLTDINGYTALDIAIIRAQTDVVRLLYERKGNYLRITLNSYCAAVLKGEEREQCAREIKALFQSRPETDTKPLHPFIIKLKTTPDTPWNAVRIFKEHKAPDLDPEEMETLKRFCEQPDKKEKLLPEYRELVHLLAVIMLEKGEPENAEALFRKNLESLSSLPPTKTMDSVSQLTFLTHYYLGRCLFDKGEYREAVACYNQAQAYETREVYFQCRLMHDKARALTATGDYVPSYETLEEALKLLGNPSEDSEHSVRCLKIDLQDEIAVLGLYTPAFRTLEANKALFEKVISERQRLHPGSAELAYTLFHYGQFLLRNREFDKAQQQFTESATLLRGSTAPESFLVYPESRLAVFNRSDAGTIKAHAEKMEKWKKAKHHPDIAELYWDSALIAQRANSPGTARVYHGKAREIYDTLYGPSHPCVFLQNAHIAALGKAKPMENPQDKQLSTVFELARKKQWKKLDKCLGRISAPGEKQKIAKARDSYGKTLLHHFAIHGKPTWLAWLITNGADVNAKDDYDWTPLHDAVYRGQEKMARLLVEKKADVLSKDKRGKPPLYLACRENRTEIITLLLSCHKAGAEYKAWLPPEDIFALPLPGQRAFRLMNAVRAKRTEDVTRELSDGTVDVTIRDVFQRTPLHVAVRTGDKNMVLFLLEKGAKTDVRDDYGWTPLHCAAFCGYADIVRILVEAGAPVLTKDDNSYSPEYVAQREGFPDIAAYLERIRKALEELPEVSSLYNNVSTIASDRNTLSLAEFRKGIDRVVTVWKQTLPAAQIVALRDEKECWSLLHMAARIGDDISTEKLIPLFKQCHQVDTVDLLGRSPLYLAVYWSNRTIESYETTIRLLKRGGASVFFRNPQGWFPLEWAGLNPSGTFLEVMRHHGSLPVDITGIDGETPLHWATLKGRKDLIEGLLEKKALLNKQNHHGWTPLHELAAQNYADLIGFLIDRGADPLKEDRHQRLPIHIAVQRGHGEAAMVLARRCPKSLTARMDDGNTYCGCTPADIAARNGDTELAKDLTAAEKLPPHSATSSRVGRKKIPSPALFSQKKEGGTPGWIEVNEGSDASSGVALRQCRFYTDAGFARLNDCLSKEMALTAKVYTETLKKALFLEKGKPERQLEILGYQAIRRDMGWDDKQLITLIEFSDWEARFEKKPVLTGDHLRLLSRLFKIRIAVYSATRRDEERDLSVLTSPVMIEEYTGRKSAVMDDEDLDEHMRRKPDGESAWLCVREISVEGGKVFLPVRVLAENESVDAIEQAMADKEEDAAPDLITTIVQDVVLYTTEDESAVAVAAESFIATLGHLLTGNGETGHTLEMVEDNFYSCCASLSLTAQLCLLKTMTSSIETGGDAALFHPFLKDLKSLCDHCLATMDEAEATPETVFSSPVYDEKERQRMELEFQFVLGNLGATFAVESIGRESLRTLIRNHYYDIFKSRIDPSRLEQLAETFRHGATTRQRFEVEKGVWLERRDTEGDGGCGLYAVSGKFDGNRQKFYDPEARKRFTGNLRSYNSLKTHRDAPLYGPLSRVLVYHLKHGNFEGEAKALQQQARTELAQNQKKKDRAKYDLAQCFQALSLPALRRLFEFSVIGAETLNRMGLNDSNRYALSLFYYRQLAGACQRITGATDEELSGIRQEVLTHFSLLERLEREESAIQESFVLNETVFKAYLDMASHPGYWLHTEEIELSAILEDKTVVLYGYDEKQQTLFVFQKFNEGKSAVAHVYFDGINHYERLEAAGNISGVPLRPPVESGAKPAYPKPPDLPPVSLLSSRLERNGSEEVTLNELKKLVKKSKESIDKCYKGQLAEAQHLCDEVFEKLKSSPAIPSLSWAYFYMNQGLIKEFSGVFEEARYLFRCALQLLRQTEGTRIQAFAKVSESITTSFLGRSEEAFQELSRAADMYRKVRKKQKNTEDIGLCYFYMAACKLEQGKTGEAEGLLEIARKTLGNSKLHLYLGTLYTFSAALCFQKGDYETALAFCKDAAGEYEAQLGETPHLVKTRLLIQLGHIQVAKGDLPGAWKTLTEVEKGLTVFKGKTAFHAHRSSLEAAIRLAEAPGSLDSPALKTVTELLLKAINRLRKVYGTWLHPDIARAVRVMGEAHLKANETENGTVLLKLAESLLRKSPDYNPSSDELNRLRESNEKLLPSSGGSYYDAIKKTLDKMYPAWGVILSNIAGPGIAEVPMAFLAEYFATYFREKTDRKEPPAAFLLFMGRLQQWGIIKEIKADSVILSDACIRAESGSSRTKECLRKIIPVLETVMPANRLSAKPPKENELLTAFALQCLEKAMPGLPADVWMALAAAVLSHYNRKGQFNEVLRLTTLPGFPEKIKSTAELPDSRRVTVILVQALCADALLQGGEVKKALDRLSALHEAAESFTASGKTPEDEELNLMLFIKALYGYALYVLGDGKASKEILKQALTLMEKCPGKARRHIEALIYNNFGYACLDTEPYPYSEAERYFSKSRILLIDRFPAHPYLGYTYNGLGRLCLMRGELAAAKRHFERAKVVYELCYANTLHPDKDEVLLGEYCVAIIEQNKPRKKEIRRDAEHIFNPLQSGNHYYIAQSYFVMARILESLRQRGFPEEGKEEGGKEGVYEKTAKFYGKSLALYKKNKTLYQKQIERIPPEYDIWHTIQRLIDMDLFEQAAKQLKEIPGRAAEEIEDTDIAALEEQVQKHWLNARILIRQDLYTEAEESLNTAFSYYDKLRPEGNLYALLHLERGVLYQSQGKYKEAIEEFERIPKLAKVDEEIIRQSLGHAATSFHCRGNYKKALKKYGEITWDKDDLVNRAANEAGRGSQLDNMGRFKEGIVCYRNALVWRQQKYGEMHYSVASAYTCLGSLYVSAGRISEAIKALDTGIDIRKKRLGETHPVLSYSYRVLATALMIKGRPSEAREAFYTALDIRNKMVNKGMVCFTFGGKGVLHDCKGHEEMLVRVYGKELNGRGTLAIPAHYETLISGYGPLIDMFKSSTGKNLPRHPVAAVWYGCLGSWYETQGNWAEAIEYHGYAREIREETIRHHTLEKNHPALGRSLYGLANGYLGSGNKEKAAELYLQAMAILRETEPGAPEYTDALRRYQEMRLAQIRLMRDGREQAKQLDALCGLAPVHTEYSLNLTYRRALAEDMKAVLKILVSDAPGDPLAMVMCYRLGNFHMVNEDYVTAYEYFREGIRLFDTVSARDAESEKILSFCLQGLGWYWNEIWLHVSKSTHNLEDVESNLARCIQIRGTHFGHDAPETIRSRHEHAVTLMIRQREDKYEAAKKELEALIPLLSATDHATRMRLARVYCGLGEACKGLGLYMESEQWFGKSIAVFEDEAKEPQDVVAMCPLLYLAQLYIRYCQKEPQKQAFYLEKAAGCCDKATAILDAIPSPPERSWMRYQLCMTQARIAFYQNLNGPAGERCRAARECLELCRKRSSIPEDILGRCEAEVRDMEYAMLTSTAYYNWPDEYAFETFYVPRTPLLTDLDKAFESQADQSVKKVCLTGITESGKSWLAGAYGAYLKKKELIPPGLVWFDARDPEHLKAEFTVFMSCILKTPPPVTLPDKRQINACYHTMAEEKRSWVMVFNGACHEDVINDLLPGDGFDGTLYILITSRQSGFFRENGRGREISLNRGVSEQEASTIVLNTVYLTRRQTGQLAKAVGYQPGDLVRVSRKIAHERALGNRTEEDIIREAVDGFREGSKVARQVTGFLGKIDKSPLEQMACGVLILCAYVQPEGIPHTLLEEYYRHIGGTDSPALKDVFIFLGRSSLLIPEDPDQQTGRRMISPLVQRCIRQYLAQFPDLRRDMLAALNKAFTDEQELPGLLKNKPVLAHIECLLQELMTEKTEGAEAELLIDLLTTWSDQMIRLGKFEQPLHYLSKAKTILSAIENRASLNDALERLMLSVRVQSGWISFLRGYDPAQAEADLKAASEGRGILLGPDHPKTIRAKNLYLQALIKNKNHDEFKKIFDSLRPFFERTDLPLDQEDRFHLKALIHYSYALYQADCENATDKALEECDKGIALYKQYRDKSVFLARLYTLKGRLLFRQGSELTAAKEAFETGYILFDGQRDVYPDYQEENRYWLARCLLRMQTPSPSTPRTVPNNQLVPPFIQTHDLTLLTTFMENGARRLLISGKSGLGKETLADTYLRLNGRNYDRIFTLCARDETALRRGYDRIARELSLPETNGEPDDFLREIQAALSGLSTPWLLVVSHASLTPDELKRVLPPLGTCGHCLLLPDSRTPDPKAMARTLDMPLFEMREWNGPERKALWETLQPGTTSGITMELPVELPVEPPDWPPLLMNQVSLITKKTGQDMRKDWPQLSAAEAKKKIYTLLSEHYPEAAAVMALCACIAQPMLPADLIRDILGLNDRTREVLALLNGLSLGKIPGQREEPDNVNAWALRLYDAVLDWEIPAGYISRMRERFLLFFEETWRKNRDYGDMVRLLPHLEKLIGGIHETLSMACMPAIICVIRFLNIHGDYRQAMEWSAKACTLLSAQKDGATPWEWKVRMERARTLAHLNQTGEAKEELTVSFKLFPDPEITPKAAIDGDIAASCAYRKLIHGTFLGFAGDLENAFIALEKARMYYSLAEGVYLPDRSYCRVVLGIAALFQGNLGCAQKELEKALEDYRENKVNRHPELALGMIYLAMTRLEQGHNRVGAADLETFREQFKKAMAMLDDCRIETHPYRAAGWVLDGLILKEKGLLLKREGKLLESEKTLGEAEQSVQKAIELYKRIYPDEDKLLLKRAIGLLGSIQFENHNPAQAEKSFRQALVPLKSARTPQLFQILYNGYLVRIMEKKGEIAAAFSYMREADQAFQLLPETFRTTYPAVKVLEETITGIKGLFVSLPPLKKGVHLKEEVTLRQKDLRELFFRCSGRDPAEFSGGSDKPTGTYLKKVLVTSLPYGGTGRYDLLRLFAELMRHPAAEAVTLLGIPVPLPFQLIWWFDSGEPTLFEKQYREFAVRLDKTLEGKTLSAIRSELTKTDKLDSLRITHYLLIFNGRSGDVDPMNYFPVHGQEQKETAARRWIVVIDDAAAKHPPEKMIYPHPYMVDGKEEAGKLISLCFPELTPEEIAKILAKPYGKFFPFLLRLLSACQKQVKEKEGVYLPFTEFDERCRKEYEFFGYDSEKDPGKQQLIQTAAVIKLILDRLAHGPFSPKWLYRLTFLNSQSIPLFLAESVYDGGPADGIAAGIDFAVQSRFVARREVQREGRRESYMTMLPLIRESFRIYFQRMYAEESVEKTLDILLEKLNGLFTFQRSKAETWQSEALVSLIPHVLSVLGAKADRRLPFSAIDYDLLLKALEYTVWRLDFKYVNELIRYFEQSVRGMTPGSERAKNTLILSGTGELDVPFYTLKTLAYLLENAAGAKIRQVSDELKAALSSLAKPLSGENDIRLNAAELILGFCAQRLGQPQEAKRRFAVLLTHPAGLTPDTALLHLGMGIVLGETGEFDASRVHLLYARLICHNAGSPLALFEAFSLLALGFNDLLHGHTDEVRHYVEHAEFHLKEKLGSGELSKADPKTGRLTFTNVHAFWSLPRMLLGAACITEGRYDEAATSLEEALHILEDAKIEHPYVAEIRRYQGMIHLAKGEYDKAEAEFKASHGLYSLIGYTGHPDFGLTCYLLAKTALARCALFITPSPAFSRERAISHFDTARIRADEAARTFEQAGLHPAHPYHPVMTLLTTEISGVRDKLAALTPKPAFVPVPSVKLEGFPDTLIREKLRLIEQKLAVSGYAVISGSPNSGKTNIALSYATQQTHYYCRWFFPMKDEAMLAVECDRLFGKLDITEPPPAEVDKALDMLNTRFETLKEQALLIFDRASEAMCKRIPEWVLRAKTPHLHIILIPAAAAEEPEAVPMALYPYEASIQFLQEGIKKSGLALKREEISRILTDLGYEQDKGCPMVSLVWILTMFSAFTKLTLQKYLDELRQCRSSQVKEPFLRAHQRQLELALRLFCETYPHWKPLLVPCAYLYPVIPLKWLTEYARHLPHPLHSQVSAFIGGLEKFGLIAWRTGDRLMVYDFTRVEIARSVQTDVTPFETFCRTLFQSSDPDRELLLHRQSVMKALEEKKLASEPLLRFFNISVTETGGRAVSPGRQVSASLFSDRGEQLPGIEEVRTLLVEEPFFSVRLKTLFKQALRLKAEEITRLIREKYPEITDCLEECLELEERAEHYYGRYQFGKALKKVLKCLEKNPYEYDYYWFLQSLLFQSHYLEAALVSLFEKRLDRLDNSIRNPEDVRRIVYRMGQALIALKTGRPDRAKTIYGELIIAFPDFLEAYRMLAKIDYRNAIGHGNEQELDRSFTNLDGDYPENQRERSHLAKVLKDPNETYDRFLRNIGNMYYLRYKLKKDKGQPEDQLLTHGIDYYKRSIEVRKNACNYCELGLIYMGLLQDGENKTWRDNAIEAFDHAAVKAPDTRNYQKVQFHYQDRLAEVVLPLKLVFKVQNELFVNARVLSFYMLVELYSKTNDDKNVTTWLTRFARYLDGRPSAPISFFLLGQAYQLARRPEEAKTSYAMAIRLQENMTQKESRTTYLHKTSIITVQNPLFSVNASMQDEFKAVLLFSQAQIMQELSQPVSECQQILQRAKACCPMEMPLYLEIQNALETLKQRPEGKSAALLSGEARKTELTKLDTLKATQREFEDTIDEILQDDACQADIRMTVLIESIRQTQRLVLDKIKEIERSKTGSRVLIIAQQLKFLVSGFKATIKQLEEIAAAKSRFSSSIACMINFMNEEYDIVMVEWALQDIGETI